MRKTVTAMTEPADESTRSTEVDAVIGALDRLDEAPVDEHVAIFEAAHERLRAALTDAGDGPAAS